MADKKISALTGASTPLAGTEVLPIVQSSTTKQVSVANLTAGRAVGMASNVINANTVVPSAGAITGSNLWQLGGDSVANGYLIDNFNSGATITGRRANGTAAAPAAISISSILLNIRGYGYGATGYSATSRSGIQMITNENWTDAAQGTRVVFNATPAGSTTQQTVATIDGGGDMTVSVGNLVQGTAAKGVTTGGAFSLGLGTNGSTTQAIIDTSGNLAVTGNTTTAKVSTLEGTTGTIANGATATLFALPAVGSYLVTARQAGAGNGGIRAAAIVMQGSSTNGTSALFSVACTLSSGTGFNVSLTNNAGGDAAFTWSYVKLAS
tara:strand:- start:100 stop:1071 length:972 start_codon:yes stop_codon:yes gene_type:complete